MVRRSILEAVKMGIWDYEPGDLPPIAYNPADAMPGTREKIDILAARILTGQPLWHPHDREDAEAPPPRTRPR